MEDDFRVVHGVSERLTDDPDAFRVEGMIVFHPPEIDEEIADLSFLVRRHEGLASAACEAAVAG